MNGPDLTCDPIRLTKAKKGAGPHDDTAYLRRGPRWPSWFCTIHDTFSEKVLDHG